MGYLKDVPLNVQYMYLDLLSFIVTVSKIKNLKCLCNFINKL